MLILYILFISCSSSIPQEKKYKQVYIEEFKLVYFKACLKNSFDNEAIRYLNNIDRSGMTEPILGTRVYAMIDSLSKITISKDYKYGEVAEGAEGKHIYSECLRIYQSKWLDSIAQTEYKKMKKIEMDFYKNSGL